jgi:hypothetical protein
MRKKKTFKKMLMILGILLLILIVLVAIDMKAWKYLEKKEVRMIPLTDKCSVLFNEIIHTIKDGSSCENYCRAECLSRKMKFYNSEFSLNQEGCNACNCYCK